MYFIFGWNNFKVKDYTLQDMGIPNPDNSPIKIQLRQKYFHLFFIPFFGLKQYWVMVKAHKKYEIPLEYVMAIRNKNIRLRSPWYTYSGFIIIALIILGFLATIPIQSYMHHRSRMKDIEMTRDMLEHPQTNDYYLIFASDNDFAMRVDSVTNTAVKFYVPLFDSTSTDPFQSYGVNDLAYFDDTTKLFKHVWIKKELINKSYGGEDSYRDFFKGALIPELNFFTQQPVKLGRIDRKKDGIR